jgi:hypothetical protein
MYFLNINAIILRSKFNYQTTVLVHLKSLVPAQWSLKVDKGTHSDTLSPFKNMKFSLTNHNESLKTFKIFRTPHYLCPRARQLLWELIHKVSIGWQFRVHVSPTVPLTLFHKEVLKSWPHLPSRHHTFWKYFSTNSEACLAIQATSLQI